MGIFFIAIGFAILIALILRFIQPELIYSVRQALIKSRTNKLFLDQDAGRGRRHIDEGVEKFWVRFRDQKRDLLFL